MKKFWITLLSVVTLVCCVFGVAACKSNDPLATYTLKENGSLVYEDFELPSKIGDKSVSWTSDNAAITVEARKGEDYLAKVTLGDEAVSTKLTVKQGKQTKDFTVTVGALDVSYFVQKFVFENENATVFEDFELPTSFTLLGKTASIKWSVEREMDKGYISIAEEGGKTMCKVNQSSLNPDVRLYAEFEYNGQKQKTNYRMTVSFERTHIETVDYWYYNTGVSIKMSGYVVAIGTAYSTQYENVTLYMVDDDFCAGYYLYRVKASKADGALLKPGVHVTVTGTTNTNYNGLIETNAGGNLVVDQDKEEIDVTQYVYALDNDLLAHSREAVYHTSTLVSLTNWKIKSMYKSAPAEGATSTLFTLEKGDVEVSVAISKYMEGVYATKESDATYKALADLYTSLKVGDVVTVTGILGNYNGFQIIPLKAADVVKAAEGTAESAVPEACTKVASAIEKVETLFKEKGISSVSESSKLFKSDTGYIIVADQEIELPTEEGVEIKYELIHGSGTVKVEEGKLIVTVGAEDMASLQVTYTVKDGEGKALYSTRTFHIVHSMKMNDQDIVEKLRFDFVLETTSTVVDPVELTTSVKEYPSASISWALKEPVAGVTIEDNKIVVTADTEKDRKVTLVATFTSNDKSVTKEYDFTVEQAIPFKAGTYKLAIKQNGIADKPTLYFTGTMDGYYGKTTTDYIDAIDVVVTEEESGYRIKAGDNYIELRVSGTHINFTLVPEAEKTGTWEYNFSLKTFTWAAEGTKYYMGTSGTYKTVSLNDIAKVTGTNASKIGVSEFVAFFEEPKQLTEEEIAAMKAAQNAQKALDAIGTIADITEAKSITLPASTIEGVTISWALAADNAATSAALTGSTLAVATMPEATETVKLVATATCGGATKTKAITVTIKVASADATNYGTTQAPLSVTQALAITADECKADGNVTAEIVTMTGKVTNVPTNKGNYYQTLYLADLNDASKSILVYTINLRSGVDAPAQNDVLVISGYIKNYGGVMEFASNSGTYVFIESNTRGNSTVTLGAHDGAEVTGIPAAAVANGSPVTITVVAASGKQIAAVKANGTRVTESTETAGTYTFTVLGNTEVTVETQDEGTPTPPPTNYGTLQAPISVTEALAIAQTECPLSGAYTEQIVYMTGKVSAAPSGKNLNVADLNDASKTILVYDSSLKDGVTALVQNDVVVISGYITNYKYGDPGQEGGTIEFSKNGSTLVYVESKTLGTSTITLTVNEDQATVTGLSASATNGTEIPFTVAAKAGYELVSVKVNNQAVTANAEGGYTLTVAGNMTVVVETKVEGSVTPTTTWTKVTSANASEKLVAGAKIILTYNDAFAMGEQSGKFREKVDFNATNVASDVVIVTLEDAGDGKFYLKVSDGYLYAVSGKNELHTSAEKIDAGKWTITVATDGKAEISVALSATETRSLDYNPSSPRFAAYSNAQQDPTIYVEVGGTTGGTTTGGDTDNNG